MSRPEIALNVVREFDNAMLEFDLRSETKGSRFEYGCYLCVEGRNRPNNVKVPKIRILTSLLKI